MAPSVRVLNQFLKKCLLYENITHLQVVLKICVFKLFAHFRELKYNYHNLLMNLLRLNRITSNQPLYDCISCVPSVNSSSLSDLLTKRIHKQRLLRELEQT